MNHISARVAARFKGQSWMRYNEDDIKRDFVQLGLEVKSARLASITRRGLMVFPKTGKGQTKEGLDDGCRDDSGRRGLVITLSHSYLFTVSSEIRFVTPLNPMQPSLRLFYRM